MDRLDKVDWVDKRDHGPSFFGNFADGFKSNGYMYSAEVLVEAGSGTPTIMPNNSIYGNMPGLLKNPLLCLWVVPFHFESVIFPVGRHARILWPESYLCPSARRFCV